MKEPITGQDFFFADQISRIVNEQTRTNELLQQLLDILKPPTEKGVEQVERNTNDKPNKRKHR